MFLDAKELPDGWLIAPLEELLETLMDFRGRTPKKLGMDWGDGTVPALSALNVRPSEIQLERTKHFGSVALHDRWMVAGATQKGDVVITTEAPLGNVAQIPDEKLYILSQRVILLRPYPELMLNNFLACQLRSDVFQKLLQANDSGSTVRGIRQSRLVRLATTLPPLNEQRRIVTKIEELTAHSKRAREALDDVPTLINQFRQSVLAAAFRGDLTADWREKNPDVESAKKLLERIRIERRDQWEEAELERMRAKGKEPKDNKWKKRYKEPEKFDGSGLLELPNSWIWVSADECTSLITDGEHATPERTNEGVYLLSARNVLNGKLSLEKVDYIAKELFQKLNQRLNITAGDVLLSCSGTVGRSCTVPEGLECSFVRSVAILRPLLGMGQYLSNSIRAPIVQAQIDRKKTQTAQSNLFQGRIKVLAFPLAPLQEQTEIIRQIAHCMSVADALEKHYVGGISDLNQLDQSILAKAFRGDLVPQDPTDEPASALLDRIRTEREKLATTKQKGRTPRQKTKPDSIEQLSL